MTVTERAVPLRPKRPEPATCNTCGDEKVVIKIRAGWNLGGRCPDCNGGSW
jgi:hypothetical protein